MGCAEAVFSLSSRAVPGFAGGEGNVGPPGVYNPDWVDLPPAEIPYPGTGEPSTVATGGSGTQLPYGGNPNAPAADVTPGMSDQDMINKLGYDPGDPRNNLTSGFGSGVPTQRALGFIGNFLGNAAFPGLGQLTGPAAAKITQMIQNGAGKAAVQNAISQYQGGGGGGTPDSGGKGTPGVFNPGYSDPAYLRSMGYGPGQGTGSLWPGATGNWGYNQDNPDSPQYDPMGPAAGGFSGGVGGNGGSFFHDLGGVRGGPLAGSFMGLGAGGGGMMAPGMANLYLHSSNMQNMVQGMGYNNVGDWLRRTGFSLGGAGGGSGAGLAGAERPFTKTA